LTTTDVNTTTTINGKQSTNLSKEGNYNHWKSNISYHAIF
jgi:hypothetical protein